MTGAKPEMHFHHLVTLALILISDVLGYRRVGAVVMLLHDAPDVFSALIKGSIATKNVPMTIVSYAGLLVAWGYYRLYLFALVRFLIHLVWSNLWSHLPNSLSSQ